MASEPLKLGALFDFKVFEQLILNNCIPILYQDGNEPGDSDDDDDASSQNSVVSSTQGQDGASDVVGSSDTDMTDVDLATETYRPPPIDPTLDRTAAVLSRLSSEARKNLDRQPISTLLTLKKQATPIFTAYSRHGNQARYSADVMKFLKGGDTIRGTGPDYYDKNKDQKLKLTPFGCDNLSNGSRTSTAAQNMDDRTRDIEKQNATQGSYGMLGLSTDKPAMEQRSRIPSGESTSSARSSQPSMATGFYDPSLRTLQSQESLHVVAGSMLRSNQILTPIPNMSNHNTGHLTPYANAEIPRQLLSNNSFTLTTDLTTNRLLQHTDFEPISMTFRWPGLSHEDVGPLAPTPGLLDSLNRIIKLYNLQAQHLLNYLIQKYLPIAGHDDLPHALFRLGITHLVQSQIEDILSTKEQDKFGLNPHNRRLLKNVFERCGGSLIVPGDPWIGREEELMAFDESYMVRRGGARGDLVTGLNPLEKQLLARACSITVAAVESWWADYRYKRRGWAALKAWCDIQDARIVNKAMAEGRW